MRLALALALLAAGPARSQEALGGDAFEALVEGRSLGWNVAGEGAPYGIERYYPGRRVTWFRVATGECLEGRWYVEGPKDDPAICFLYEDSPVPDCWATTSDGKSLRAVALSSSLEIAVDLGKAHDLPFGCEYLGS